MSRYGSLIYINPSVSSYAQSAENCLQQIFDWHCVNVFTFLCYKLGHGGPGREKVNNLHQAQIIQDLKEKSVLNLKIKLFKSSIKNYSNFKGKIGFFININSTENLCRFFKYMR